MKRFVSSIIGSSISKASSASYATSIYQWDDPFDIQSLLTEEERSIQDSVRKYATEKLMPRITPIFRSESNDMAFFKEAGSMGLLGSTLQGYGCAGLSEVAGGLICREVERIDSGYRSQLSVTGSLVMYPIHSYATEEMKQLLLPQLASGDLIGCFGLTEANAGSDPGSMTSRCERKGSEWILSGEKMWISNSPFADVFVVWAKDKADGKIRGFILRKGMEGLSAPPIIGKLSLRASKTGYIVMDNVRVPDSHRLLVEGLKGPFSCLNSARFGISWGGIGAGEFCLDYVRKYVLDRKQFGKPLASKQLVQTKLADMSTELSMSLLACYRAARMKEEGRLPHELVSMLKRTATMAGLKAARTSRDMMGANGIIDEHHVMRHVCNLETVVTYEGTYDIHGLILGRAITGIEAF